LIKLIAVNYEKIYEDYYSKSFDRMELMIKNFFIKRRSRKRFFVDSCNEVTGYFSIDFKSKYNLHNNNDLKIINLIFHNRFSAYSSDATAEILENEIKSGYDKIKTEELPVGYNYAKFIKEMALIEAAKEISRVLSVNSRLLSMFFELNKFDDFEVRDYVNSTLDDSPIFRKLHRERYPDYYLYNVENIQEVTIESSITECPKEVLVYENKIWFLVGCLVATGEMGMLLEKHKSATKVAKFLNIKGGRPYITDSINNIKKDGTQSIERNTNIFNDLTKIEKIHAYCIKNKKSMTDDFTKILSKIECN